MAYSRQIKNHVLLVLPAPPSPKAHDVKEAYDASLSHLFQLFSKSLRGSDLISVLDVGIIIPKSLSSAYQPRSNVFPVLQQLFASFYSLVGIAAAAENLELDGPGGLDVRAFILDGSPESESTSLEGPILSLHAFMEGGRHYDTCYIPDSDSGDSLVATFKHKVFFKTLSRIPAGHYPSSWAENVSIIRDHHQKYHHSVILGGTFDHLHLGHKLLLTALALALDRVTKDDQDATDRFLWVCVTGDELLVNKKYAEALESWDKRCHNTMSFLAAILDFGLPRSSFDEVEKADKPGPNGKWVKYRVTPTLFLRLVEISDPFGPTVTEENVSALIVSKETLSGGNAINEERVKKGWASLEIFEIDLLQNEQTANSANITVGNFESKISSTDIRRRRMNLAKGSL